MRFIVSNRKTLLQLLVRLDDVPRRLVFSLFRLVHILLLVFTLLLFYFSYNVWFEGFE